MREGKSAFDGFSTPVESVAAHWFVRQRSGEMEEEEQVLLEAWLAKDPYRRDCFSRFALVLELTRDLKDDPEIAALLKPGAHAAPGGLGLGILRRPHWAAAAVALVAAVAWAIFFRIDERHYTTAVGEQRVITLPDESEVILNTDTSVSIFLSRGKRTVEIARGEAYFKVKRDASRPFEVLTGDGIARAVGTEFVVGALGSQTTVSVLKGRVFVAALRDEREATYAAGPVLSPNQTITYVSGGEMGMVNEADVRRIEGWRAGKLNFDKQPLRLAVEEFNRYTNRKVFLASADIGELPVSGVLEIGDVDSLILLLRESIGLSVEWSEKQVVVKSKWS